MSKEDQLRAFREARHSSRGVDPKKSAETHPTASPASVRAGPREAKPIGDGVALKSMEHPPGLIDAMAKAIRSGKLNLKRGRPRLEEKREASSKPWVKAGMSRASWYRRQAEKKSK